MVMPSIESWGFAFCEASAYSLPSLCLRVGGVPVRDGRNGYAVDDHNSASALFDISTQLIDTPDDYINLRKTTREEFDTRLNWDVWGQSVARELNTLLSSA